MKITSTGGPLDGSYKLVRSDNVMPNVGETVTVTYEYGSITSNEQTIDVHNLASERSYIGIVDSDNMLVQFLVEVIYNGD